MLQHTALSARKGVQTNCHRAHKKGTRPDPAKTLQRGLQEEETEGFGGEDEPVNILGQTRGKRQFPASYLTSLYSPYSHRLKCVGLYNDYIHSCTLQLLAVHKLCMFSVAV